MQFKSLSPKETAEVVYINVLNGSGSALSNGDVVVWDSTADDGYTVTTTTTAASKLAAGVIIDSIAAGETGRMQVYGYHSAVKIDGGTTDVAADDLIGTGGAAGYAFTSSTLGTILGVSIAGVTTKTTGKAFIKCM